MDRTERIKGWTVEQADYFLRQETALLAEGRSEARAEQIAFLETERRFALPPPAEEPAVSGPVTDFSRVQTTSIGEAAYYLLSGCPPERIECRWVEAAGVLCSFVFSRESVGKLLRAYLDGTAEVPLRAYLSARRRIRSQMWTARAAFLCGLCK